MSLLVMSESIEEGQTDVQREWFLYFTSARTYTRLKPGSPNKWPLITHAWCMCMLQHAKCHRVVTAPIKYGLPLRHQTITSSTTSYLKNQKKIHYLQAGCSTFSKEDMYSSAVKLYLTCEMPPCS